MKVKVIINLCVIVMCFTSFSCSQDEEVYSCNKEVNAWVKENLSGIQQMDRIDWLQLDEGLKRGVYVAFEPEQKQMFWIEKIHEILLLDWNELEKRHIEVLYQTILDNPNWFSDDFSKNESEFEEFEIFTFKWMEYAEERLGWDKNLIGAIVATGNKLLDTTGRIQINTNSSVRLKSNSEVDCDCNWSTNICGLYFKACDEASHSNCKKKPGCGFFNQYECDGLCVR